MSSLGASAAAAPRPGDDVAINAESRTYYDDGVPVSILSVHTLVCPLIRAELRGGAEVRVLVYYHAETRLGLHAYEAVLRDDPLPEGLSLGEFVRSALGRADTPEQLRDPAIRELYLHEVIRRLSHSIGARQLRTDREFVVTQII